MGHLIDSLEECLVSMTQGEWQLSPNVDPQEAVQSIREELEELLTEDAHALLERTKTMSREEQLVAWRAWLFNDQGGIHPWRNDVYCESDETPTIPG